MTTVSIPLNRLIVDLDKDFDWAAHLPADIEVTVRDCYSFLPSPLEVEVGDGVAHVRSLKKAPKNIGEVPDLMKRGVAFAERGNFAKAIDNFNRVLERDPGHVEARRSLGMALLETNRLEDGRQKLVETTRLTPSDAWTYLLLANSYSKHDDHPRRAVRFYERALELQPDDLYLLSSYGGTLINLGQETRGRQLLEHALSINPYFPNAAYGVALGDMERGHPEAAEAALARLFQGPRLSDRRTVPLYEVARELDVQANLQIAEEKYDSFMQTVDSARHILEEEGGVPIEVTLDNSIPTHAMAKMAWNHNTRAHRILYKDKQKAVVPHTLAHELQHIHLEINARRLERNRSFVSSAKSREVALRSMSREIEALQRKGYDESQIMQVVLQTLNGLINQLFNIPLDMVIESGIARSRPELAPSQICWLYTTNKDIEGIYSNPQIRKLTLPTIYNASAALNYAFALFSDWVTGNRLDFGERFKKIDGFNPTTVKQGEKIFAMFREMMGEDDTRYKFGDEYAFVDRVAELLNLSQWYEWRFQGEGGDVAPVAPMPESLDVEERPEGTTNPELLRSKNMASVMYILGALERFEKMSDNDVRLIAFEVAMVGQSGLDYADPERKYHLRTLPDEEFTGLQLMALMFVGFKRIDSSLDTGIDFEEPYQTALQLFEAKR